MVTKQFAIGVLLGLSLAACAGATFPYKFYGVSLEQDKLLGPTPADDISLSLNCHWTNADASPCVAMLDGVFYAMKQDYLDTKNKLIACEHQLAIR